MQEQLLRMQLYFDSEVFMTDKMDAFQHPFELGRSISMIYRIGRWHMESQLTENTDLSGGQHTFLFYLYHHDGATQEEISRALSIDKASTARAIQKLEEKNYVTRVSNEKDKRVNHVHLTQKGWTSEKELKKNAQAWKAILVDGLNNEELQMMETIIEKLSNNASKYKNEQLGKGGTHDK